MVVLLFILVLSVHVDSAERQGADGDNAVV